MLFDQVLSSIAIPGLRRHLSYLLLAKFDDEQSWFKFDFSLKHFDAPALFLCAPLLCALFVCVDSFFWGSQNYGGYLHQLGELDVVFHIRNSE